MKKYKLLLPENLDLHSLIKDEQLYRHLCNVGGKLSAGFKRGKVIRKLIPTMQYFISTIICTDEAQGDYRVKGFKRIRISDVEHIMSYKKMKQVISFLLHQEIIELRVTTEFIVIDGRELGIHAKYFKLREPYNGKTRIQEVELKPKRRVLINDRAKFLIETNDVIRHQYEMCSNYSFNADLAESLANQLFDKKLKTDKQYVSMLKYIDRLRNQSVLFKSNEKTDRIFTIINMCHKELRDFFYVKQGNQVSALVELDFVTFNIQVLHKLINDGITITNIEETLVKELDTMEDWLQNDFYKRIQDISESYGTTLSREAAKDLALKHWQNSRPDSWHPETKIMRTIFPKITERMDELKGNSYSMYLKYSNDFMRVESKLTQLIYSTFFIRHPEAIIYNVFDAFLVEADYKNELKTVMEECSKIYFNREIRIREKVTNILQ